MTTPYVLRPLNEDPDEGPDKKPPARGYTLRPLSSMPTVASDATNARTMRDPLQLYDQTTGAPARVRLALAAAGSPEDQLETLKRFYPDAHIAPGGKLAFTNPETGKPTLVNERWGAGKFLGFSGGDILAGLPEIGGAVGGVAGAAAGATSTGPLAPIGAKGGAAIGSTLGFAGGKKAGELILKGVDALMPGEAAQDTRTPGEMLQETAGDLVTGLAMETGARVLPMLMPAPLIRGLRQGGRVLREGVRTARSGGSFTDVMRGISEGRGALPATTVFGGKPVEAADAMMRQGITRDGFFGTGPAAPLGDLTESHFTRGLSSGVEQGLGGGAIHKAQQEAAERLGSRAAQLADDAANVTLPGGSVASGLRAPGPLTPGEEATRAARTALRQNSERFIEENNKLLRQAFDGPAGAKLVQPTEVQRTLDRMKATVEEFPTLRANKYDEAIQQLERITKAAEGTTKMVPSPIGATDAAGNIIMVPQRVGGGGIPVKELKTVMSDLGEYIGKAEREVASKGSSSAGSIGPLKEAYGALTREIESQLDAPALAAWNQQRALVTARRSADNPMNEKVVQSALRAKDNKLAAFDLIMKETADRSGARAARVADLRRSTPVTQFAELRATRLNQLGRTADDAGTFTPKKFLKDLRNFGEAEQRAWGLTAEQQKVLRDLQSAAEALERSGSLSTNNVLYVLSRASSSGLNTLGALGGGAAGAGGGASGAIMGSAAGMAASQVAQFGLAHVLASPAIGRWFATTMRVVDRNPQALPAQLGRLLALKKTYPDEADAIESYYQQIQAATNAEAPRR